MERMGRLALVVMVCIGLAAFGGGQSSAQADSGRVIVSPFASDADGNGPALGGICVRLVGGEIDAEACSSVGVNESFSAVFNDVPDGEYVVELVSAPAGCSTAELPANVTVTEGGDEQIIPAFDCGSPTMEIHLAACTDDVADLFECHDQRIADGRFYINDAGFVTTDNNGVATGRLLAGQTFISQVSPPDDLLSIYVYCTDQNDGAVLYDGVAEGGTALFDAAGGATVVCDVYNISAATVEPTPEQPTPTPTPAPGTGGPTTTLPNTGAGESLSGGTGAGWLLLLLAAFGIATFGVARGFRKTN